MSDWTKDDIYEEIIHREIDQPGWATKQVCSCGFEAATKREWAIHEYGQGRGECPGIRYPNGPVKCSNCAREIVVDQGIGWTHAEILSGEFTGKFCYPRSTGRYEKATATGWDR